MARARRPRHTLWEKLTAPITVVAAIVGIVGTLATLVATGVVPLVKDLRGHPMRLRRTEVAFVQPYREDRLSPTLHVVFRGRGTCLRGQWFYAQGTSNPDADRCFGDTFRDHNVYDPCWVNGPTAACPTTPWGAEVAVLTLDHMTFPTPLSRRRRSHAPRHPWGLQLESGDRCRFIEGAGQYTVDGRRVNYGCRSGELVGLPNRSRPVWTIAYFPTRSVTTQTVRIARAWY